jgi:hypothetical protein
MENYSKRKGEEKYSVEISLDAEGSVEKVELRGEKSSLWKRIIGINMKKLQLLNLNPGGEKNN